MKYVRKITITVIIIAFLIAVSVGLGVIYSVKNVNLTLSTYYKLGVDEEGNEIDDITQSADYAEYKADYDALRKTLNKFNGTLVSFVNEDDVVAAIKDSGYTLESYKKVMPCTLNITLKQRIETFGVQNADGTYDMYDDDGIFLRSSEDLNNLIDGTVNVLLSASDGKALSAKTVEKVADICAAFREEFGAFRYVVDSVVYNVDDSKYHIDNITFKMRMGLQIVIADFAELLNEKIAAAHAVYVGLTAEQKLQGQIFAVKSGERPTAVYSENVF